MEKPIVFRFILALAMLFFMLTGVIEGDAASGKESKEWDYESLQREGYIDEEGQVPVIVSLNIPITLQKNPSYEKDAKEKRQGMGSAKTKKSFILESEFDTEKEKLMTDIAKIEKKIPHSAKKIKAYAAGSTTAKTKRPLIDKKPNAANSKTKASTQEQPPRSKEIAKASLIKISKTIARLQPNAILLNDAKAISTSLKEEDLPHATSRLQAKTKDLRMLGAVAMRVHYETIDSLSSLGYVKSVRLDRKVKAFLNESISLINATMSWNLTDDLGNNLTGQNITIAIIDTGIDYTHLDLGNCTNVSFLAGECTKVIGGFDFVNNDSDPMDDNGHGTHVAAIAAGNGTLKGAAPEARLLSYKVLDDEGSGHDSDIVLGIEQALMDGADIISMSLGSDYCEIDGVTNLATKEAIDQGVIVVVAAGNEGPDYFTISSPGCTPEAITVGASCKPGQIGNESSCLTSAIALFSSRGPAFIYQKPDVVAPGVLICAAKAATAEIGIACLDSTHTAISGTSMATPHVSGATALLKQKHPDWTPAQIKAALKNTATDLEIERLGQGQGLINILKAINTSTPPPVSIIQNLTFAQLHNHGGT